MPVATIETGTLCIAPVKIVNPRGDSYVANTPSSSNSASILARSRLPTDTTRFATEDIGDNETMHVSSWYMGTL